MSEHSFASNFLTKEELAGLSTENYKFYVREKYDVENGRIKVYSLEGFTVTINGQVFIYEFARYNCYRRKLLEIPEGFVELKGVVNSIVEKNKSFEEFLSTYRYGNRKYCGDYSNDDDKNFKKKLLENGYKEFSICSQGREQFLLLASFSENYFYIFTLNLDLIYNRFEKSYTQPYKAVPYDFVLDPETEEPIPIECCDSLLPKDELLKLVKEQKEKELHAVSVEDSDLPFLNINKTIDSEAYLYFDKKVTEGKFKQIWFPRFQHEWWEKTDEDLILKIEETDVDWIDVIIHLDEIHLDEIHLDKPTDSGIEKYLLVNQYVKKFELSDDTILHFNCYTIGDEERIIRTLVTEKFVYLFNYLWGYKMKGYPRNKVEEIIGEKWIGSPCWEKMVVDLDCGKLHRFDQTDFNGHVNCQEFCQCPDPNLVRLCSYMNINTNPEETDAPNESHLYSFPWDIDYESDIEYESEEEPEEPEE